MLRRHPRLARRVIPALLLAGTAFILSRPQTWTHYEYHPPMAQLPRTALSRNRLPADPLNLALVGHRDDVVQSFISAGWYPADPITFRTSAEITASTLLGFRYAQAPVSNMFLWDRAQDMAFEQPVPGGARHRHHVRLWKAPIPGNDGLPLWVGAATYDMRIGLVKHTLKFTHRISPDVDAERDKLVEDLIGAGRVHKVYRVTGVGQKISGQTANGDRYFTDGEMMVCLLDQSGTRRTEPPARLPSALHIRLKDRFWRILRPFLHNVFPPPGEPA